MWRVHALPQYPSRARSNSFQSVADDVVCMPFRNCPASISRRPSASEFEQHTAQESEGDPALEHRYAIRFLRRDHGDSVAVRVALLAEK